MLFILHATHSFFSLNHAFVMKDLINNLKAQAKQYKTLTSSMFLDFFFLLVITESNQIKLLLIPGLRIYRSCVSVMINRRDSSIWMAAARVVVRSSVLVMTSKAQTKTIDNNRRHLITIQSPTAVCQSASEG